MKERPHFSKSPITKEEHTKLKKILDILEADPEAYDFLEPVDYTALGLNDYPSIVKNPMDLSTVKNNVKIGKYSNLGEVFSDIQLIWDNCKLYNIEGSEIYKMAIHCEKQMKKYIEKYFKQASSTVKSRKSPEKSIKRSREHTPDNEEVSSSDALSLNEKMNVTDQIRKLSNEGLAALVKFIQKECPRAYEDVDNEKVQLKIDLIDKRAYDQIIGFMDNMIKIKEIPSGILISTNGKKVTL